MKVFDVLNPLQKIDGKLFLEAAAGCGKTFAIEHILLRLILEHDVAIENCLVVTFTKAAATDLKKRIFSTLLKIEEALMNPSSESLSIPYLTVIQDKKMAMTRVKRAIDGLHLAPITTIHGFCKRFLTQEAFDVGIAFLDDLTVDFDEKILDSIRQLDPKRFPTVWLEQLKTAQNTIEFSLLQLIKQHLASEFIEENLPDFQSFYAEFQKLWYAFKKEKKSTSIDSLEANLVNFNGFFTKEKIFKFKKEGEIFNKLLNFDSPSVEIFEEFLTINRFFEAIDESNLSKKSLKDPKVLESCQRWIELLSPFKRLLKNALDPSLIACQLILAMQKELKNSLDLNPLFLPDFLLKQMKAVCEKTNVQKRLQELYQVVLIDEFQDTDPMQWAIFEKVFFNAKTLKLFACVGDPKQSIYAFRNADIEIYLNAKKQFSDENCYILDTNFRSEKKVIEALNYCFQEDENSAFFNFENSPYLIDYFSIKARHEKLWEPKDGKAALHFFSVLELDKKKQEDVLFHSIAKEFFSLLDQNVNPQEIAFLVKDRNQADRLKRFLEKMHVKTPPLKIDLLSDGDSYRFMKTLIACFENYHDENRLKQFFFHPFVKKEKFYSEAFIERDFKSDKEKWIKSEPKEKTAQAFLNFLTQTFETFEIFSSLLKAKKFQEYEELTQLIEWFLKEVSQGLNFDALVKKFHRLEDLKDDDSDGVKKRTFSLEPMPQIFTMHASKGLEFDVIFVLGLYLPTKDHALFFKKEENQEKKWTIHRPEILALHEIPIDMEKMRQFYVALTRAKKRIYIPLVNAFDEEKANYSTLSPLQLFFRKKILKTNDYQKIYESAVDFDQMIEQIKKIPQASIEFLDIVDFERPFKEKIEKKIIPFKPHLKPLDFKEAATFSFSSLLEKETSSKEPILTTHAVGKDFGTFIHEILEKTIESRLYDKTESLEFKSWLKELCEMTSYEAEFEEIYTMIHETMHVLIIDEKYAIKDLPYQCLMTEMKLNVNFENDGILKGFIDLMISFDGNFYLIDYKTNFLGIDANCYEKENLLKAVKENDYFLQAACYTKALEYFVIKSQIKPFKESFKGVTFLFLRGLKFHQGVLSFKDSEKLLEKFDEALLSRS